ncbi:MAG: hypothetical protein ACPGQL_11140 [Thermoplasmatota archaeon]
MMRTTSLFLSALLLAVAVPAQADHGLGCLGDDPTVCHGHSAFGDGTCNGDYENEHLIIWVGAVPAAAGVDHTVRCFDFFGTKCDQDTWIVSAQQGDAWGTSPTGYTFVQLYAQQAGCGDENRCFVHVGVYDATTGATGGQTILDQPCPELP